MESAGFRTSSSRGRWSRATASVSLAILNKDDVERRVWMSTGDNTPFLAICYLVSQAKQPCIHVSSRRQPDT